MLRGKRSATGATGGAGPAPAPRSPVAAAGLLLAACTLIAGSPPAFGSSWARFYDVPTHSFRSVAATADGGHVAALAGTGGVHLLKADAEGSTVWQRQVTDGAGTYLASVAPAGENGVFLVFSNYDPAVGHNYSWFARFDADGRAVWARRLLDTPNRISIAAALPGGALALSGDIDGRFWIAKVSAGGSILWQRKYRALDARHERAGDIVSTGDGGLIFVAQRFLRKRRTFVPNLVRLDASGDLLWKRSLEGRNLLNVTGLAFTDTGRCIAAGAEVDTANGRSDLWLGALDSRGRMIWQKRYGGEGSEWPHAVVAHRDGSISVLGSTSSPSPDRNEAWVLAVGERGRRLREWTYGGPGPAVLHDALETPDGALVAVGTTDSVRGHMHLRFNSLGRLPGCGLASGFASTVTPGRIRVRTPGLRWERPAHTFELAPLGERDAAIPPVDSCRTEHVRLLTPAPGTVALSGSSFPVSWLGSSAVQSVDLELSGDNGRSWERLASGLGAAAYDWEVPRLAHGGRRSWIRVTARDGTGAVLDADANDGPFTIAP